MANTATIKKAPTFGYNIKFSNYDIYDAWRPTHLWARRTARRKIYWYERRQRRKDTHVSSV